MNSFSQYFHEFFTPAEKALFMRELNYGGKFYTYINSAETDWDIAAARFKQLLPYGNIDSFYVEINKNATSIIDQLFNNYVQDNTFVISVLEHGSIINNVNKTKNHIVLTYDIIKAFDIDKLITAYNNSGCANLFIYGAGIIESNIIPQSFYLSLKNRLVEEGIPHFFVLDDVQGMFVVPRDYQIFDCITFTCHSLIPHYNSGIVLSKKKENLGYCDAKPLNDFLDILIPIVINKKDKLYLFKFFIEQHLAEELFNTDVFYTPKDVSWNMFYLCIRDEIFIRKIIDKYKDELAKYWINFYENTFMIKANFILQLKPEEIIKGFMLLKQVLQKCIRLKKQRSI